MHVAESRELASAGLIARWDRDRVQSPDASRIILTHTNDEVRSLNEAARERMRASGELGPEIKVQAERGSRSFATGDRVMFLKNERSLGVKNGSLGTVQSLNAMRMQVLLDDGLRLTATPVLDVAPSQSMLEKAVERYGRAAADILRMRDADQKELPHQVQAFRKAGQELDAIRPNGERDLLTAMNADRGLIDQSANGRTAAAIRAIVLEGEIRSADLERADRFVADWQRQTRQDYIGVDRARSGMAEMAKSLERDPQLESLLRNRVKELGIAKSAGVSMSDELPSHPVLSRGRGLGR